MLDVYNTGYDDAKIVAWIVTGIRHEVFRLSKQQRKIQDHEFLILNQPISQNIIGDTELEMVNAIADMVDLFSEVEDKLLFQDAINTLTLEQRKVIVAIFFQGEKESSIAARFGMSQPAVHQLKNRAINRLRTYLNQKNN